jgi:hypothetical protein
MATRALPLFVVGVLASGCVLGRVEATPLRGPAPRTIAVLPVRPPRVAIGLDEALQARGHRIVASAVASELLVGVDVAASKPALLGAATGADALLYVDVNAFEAAGVRPLREAHWDLRWRLVAAASGGEIWSWDSVGSWRHSDTDPGNTQPRPDGVLQSVPIGGPSVPSFRDDVDLLSWLHRTAFDRLPRVSR